MQPGVDDIRTLIAGASVPAEVEDALLGVVARVAPHDVIDVLSAFQAGGYESLVDFDGIDTGEGDRAHLAPPLLLDGS